MTAQPADPASTLDTGPYEMIHLGDQAAVVVPVADFTRLRAAQLATDDPVSLSLGRYLDDPDGLAEALATVDALAADPRPPGVAGGR